MASRRYGFVLLVYGVALALTLPLYLRPGVGCPPGSEFCGTAVSSPEGVMGIYDLANAGMLELSWALLLLLTSVAVGWWYRRSGQLLRAVPVLATAVVVSLLTAGLTVAGWSGFRTTSAVVETTYLLHVNGATPLVVSAFALVALAAAERSAVAAVFAVLYGGVAYVAATYDSLYVLSGLGLPVDVSGDPAGVRQLLNLAVPAAVLLLGGGFALLVGSARSARSSQSSKLRTSSSTV